MLSGSDPFATLGVSPGASRDDLTRAFRRLARITHPDKGGDPERFKAVTEAYDAARRIVSRGDDVAGTRASEPRERYDWRRGRCSFETRGEGAGGTAREPNRCDGAGVSFDAARPRGGGRADGHRAATRRADRAEADDADAGSGTTSSCSSSCSSSEDGDEDDALPSERARLLKKRETAETPSAVLPPRAAADGTARPAVSVACSRDGVVAVACLDAGVRVWDANKGALLAEHAFVPAVSAPEEEAPTERKEKGAEAFGKNEESKTRAPRASDAWWVLDGRSLLVAYDEGSVLFWDTLLNDTDANEKNHASGSSPCPSNGDGGDGCAPDEPNTRARTPTRTRTELDMSSPLSLRGHRRRVVASAWFTDPKEKEKENAIDVLVTASLDSTARVWRFSAEEGRCLSFSADARDGRNGSTAPPISDKKPRTAFRRLLSCTILPGEGSSSRGGACVTCCAITADGAFLATGDSDGVFSVWAFRDSNPFVILAQRVRWAGDASARADDAILKCAFVDAEPPFEPESFGGFGASGKNACEDRDGYRLVTAHYSRDADASRLLVWRVARKRSKLVARENGGKKNVTFATACEESGDDTDEDRTRTHDTDDATFVAEDRAFSDHAEIRGYELCVPAGGRTWRGRVADANVGYGGGAPKLVACGAAGWVTVMEVTDSGGRYSFETLYTSYDANVGARRARFLTLLSPRRDDGTKKDAPKQNGALVVVAGEDGVIVARDAEDGEVLARFAVPNGTGSVWSLGGFSSRDERCAFVVAGTADGEVARWKVPGELFGGS